MCGSVHMYSVCVCVCVCMRVCVVQYYTMHMYLYTYNSIIFICMHMHIQCVLSPMMLVHSICMAHIQCHKTEIINECYIYVDCDRLLWVVRRSVNRSHAHLLRMATEELLVELAFSDSAIVFSFRESFLYD